MKAFIRATGSYAPCRVLSNHELATMMDTSDDWIFTHTGIHNRRIADPGQAASDLGYQAAMACLKACAEDGGSSIGPADIDLIIVATATPDYPSFPSTASIVQNCLGAKKSGAMDVGAACSGFIYALETARCFVEAEIGRAHV